MWMILISDAKLKQLIFPCHTQKGTIAPRSENVPIWVWHCDWDSLNFAE